MKLFFALVKAKFRITWQNKSASVIASYIFGVLFLLTVTAGFGFLLMYKTEDQDPERIAYIGSRILYFGRFFLYYFVGITFFLPYIVHVNRKINPVYPIGPFHAFTLNYAMDIIFSKQATLAFIMLLGIFPFNGLTYLREYIGLVFSVFNIILVIRLIQNGTFKKEGKFLSLVFLGVFILYLTFTIIDPINLGRTSYLIDVIIFPILFLGTYWADRKLPFKQEQQTMRGFKFKSFWPSLFLNNKMVRGGLIATCLAPFIMVIINLVSDYTNTNFFPPITDQPFLFLLVMPSGFFMQVFNNFWVVFPALFQNIDFTQGTLKDMYRIFVKGALLIASIHFFAMIAFSLINHLDVLYMSFAYICVLAAILPMGMYFSLHHSKKIVKDGNRKGPKPNIWSIIAMFAITFVPYIILKFPHLFYINLAVPAIGIIFHFLLKEDFQKDRYTIHQQIKS